ncbi:hypothetical protein tinsulaeT_19660 [Thalassotalea insulae]|uniref:GGDEF domain-containing protein n=1 Tax=Thalassotalea insulae TaxID=2056778 RepID=A0ABQ6GRS4_9GAMM|nr:GGDEF domain-containing protein [Thalassotalea insulae]GLX78626.1 hypothetical protein tinsulaeT_19660 [Thalassotalea insulae]
MVYQLVHTIGSTIYFTIFILFLWISQVSRTSPGAGWWALATAFALLARLSLLFTTSIQDSQLQLLLYALFNMPEKACLLIGILKFLNSRQQLQLIISATVLCEALMLLFTSIDISIWFARILLIAVNISFLIICATICYHKRHQEPRKLLFVATIFTSLLAVHWLSYPIIFVIPQWRFWGFLLGTLLMLIIYLTLLAVILLNFQKRLLDAEEKALNLAYHDSLTGLKNKRYMNNLFENAVSLANRPHQLMAVLYIDLDNFKPINDNAGHKIGDEVLKIVAQRLVKHTRSTDICARVGGDEFVLIATQFENQQQVRDMVTKLLQQLQSPIMVDRTCYCLGASIGISLYPNDGNEFNELIEKADKAMYQVKGEGKSNYQFYQC